MTDAHDRAMIVAAAADAKKADDIVVLEVGHILSIAEVFVIASAPNTRQVRTIVDAVVEQMRNEAGSPPRASEGHDTSTWVLIDYGDVVVHVFLAETREFYGLERLWADAPRLTYRADAS